MWPGFFLLLSPYLAWLAWAAFRHPVPLGYNWRSLWQRWVGTLATVGAVAIVVMIFVVVRAMAAGIEKTCVKSGREDQVVVLRPNSRVELMSVVQRDQARLISTHPLVARDGQGPLATADVVVSKQVALADGTGSMSVSVRGTTPAGIRMRSHVRLVRGRWFQPNLGEVVVPRRMVGKYVGLELGRSFGMASRQWTVVGIFDGDGSAFDSEIWGDADDLVQAFHRWNAFSSVVVRLRRPQDAPAFIADMDRDVRLRLEARTEPRYFAEMSDAGKPMQILGRIITAILTVGAVFAAMNTMYSAVAGRTSEIAVLRAIGYRRREILASFQWEAILLTLLGGGLGCACACSFNGVQTGATSMNTFSDLGYAFAVTPALVGQGLAFSLVMGILGGFLPAWKASRLPIVEAMRG
ncbi:MAG TPA: FtsX-like permease family protein [Holophaga sp.]|nr:FtsX-like permease family protein [Holophaga sp.]HPS68074.1 FtsX-like permease family protein [Holophaga sp.]